MRSLIRLAGLLRPYWRPILQSLLVGVLVSLLALPGPYITKLLVDEVYPRQDVPLLHFVLLSGAAVTLCLGFIQALAAHFGQRVGALLSLDYQMRLFAHVQGLDFAFFDTRETGELLSRFEDMHSSLGQVIGMFSAAALNTLQLLVFPAILFWLSWPLALLSLLILPLDTALALVTRRVYGRLSQAIAVCRARLSAEAYETLAAVRTVQSLGLEGAMLQRLRTRFLEVAGLQVHASLVQNLAAGAATLLRAGGSLAFSYYGWLSVLEGRLSMGTFMAFSGYAAYLYGPLQSLIALVPQIEVARVHAQRFLEIYDRRPAIRDAPGAIAVTRARGEIEFRGVWFGYGDRPVLCGIDLRIPPGARVALVGRSGAGKSTLVKLIPRFYDPARGAVLLDGVDVRQLRLASLRRQVGFAMQGSALFRGTIRDNLCFGQPVTAAELEAAARAACVHACIAALPQGYDTAVGEGGCTLSEGQRQRLALARVLLLDAPVLILDEPAAALDPESEAELRRALQTACAGRTTVLIAHRRETIEAAELIVVLDAGRAVESGTHAQLQRCGGLYARMFGAAA